MKRWPTEPVQPRTPGQSICVSECVTQNHQAGREGEGKETGGGSAGAGRHTAFLDWQLSHCDRRV